MAAGPVPALSSSRWPGLAIWLSAAIGALAIGAAMALNLLAGVSILVALCYLPLVMVSLPLGIALWLPIAFLPTLSLPLPVGAAAGSLVVLAWAGTIRAREIPARRFFETNRRLLLLLGALLAWLTLSGLWARDLDRFGSEIGNWYLAVLLFLIVTTTITSERGVRLLAGAFVAGAVISLIFGLAGVDALETGLPAEPGRLIGGSGDPNYSAAGFLAGLILAAGLIPGARRPAGRYLAVGAILALAAGLAATQSRGAVVGAAVATIAALALYKGRRRQVLAIAGAAFAVIAITLSTSPSGWERVTGFGEHDPRSELWLVAWRVAGDHPLTGVGLNNFSAEAPGYVARPGSLEFVELIADRPSVAHSSVLQLLADTGLVGLALYVCFALGCLRAALRAARRFDARARDSLAEISRAVAVAIVAMLAVSLFLSSEADRRTWLLLALGPMLLAISTGAAWRRA